MSSTRASGSRWSGEADERRDETYLQSVKPGQRDKLLRELLAVEVELRIAHGENPTPAQLRLRYPDWGHAITVAFEQGARRRRRRGRGWCGRVRPR